MVVGIAAGTFYVETAEVPSFEGMDGVAVMVFGMAGAHLLGWPYFVYVLLVWTRSSGWGLRSG